jgi:acetyl-CoA carboxylase biotin carboxylase subunit
MRLLGDKVAARKLMMKANVPVVPGSEGEIKDVKEAVKIANKIGYPVIVKASAGGGGRGMRVAHNDISLQTAFGAAKSEAEANFNDGTMYLEKYIVEPRHVEVQVMADKFGNVVHFYERDCSVQRRHQKLIEESPCPVLDEKTRQILCNSAIKAIKASKYENAATVEFILDKDQNYYFIEANTRIQVEHPVTEMVTGYDLIKYQIKVAAGEKLDITQDDIKHNGVAIECRINAEDPYNNFAPSPGKISLFYAPGGRGVRVDTHVYSGYEVPPNYDSMIAKLIVTGATREIAIARMIRSLNEFVIKGIKTTIPFQASIMKHNAFRSGDYNIAWVEKFLASQPSPPDGLPEIMLEEE